MNSQIRHTLVDFAMPPARRRAACWRGAYIVGVVLSFALSAVSASAQQLILNTVGAPTVVGSNVGKRALWTNAGTVGGVSVDIVGELTSTALNHLFQTGAGKIQIRSIGQDPHFIDFRIYEAGTYDVNTDSGGVPVAADVFVQINDIDGPANEQVYVPICDGTVEFVRVDRSATTYRGFIEGPDPDVGTEQFFLAGDKGYSNEPVSGLEISYPNTSSFSFGRTANSNFLVRLANPTYDEAQTFDLQCGDFKPPVLQNDLKEQILGEPVNVDILVNDSVATENDNGPANNSLQASEYARQAIDLAPPVGAINIVTDSEGRRTGFEVVGEGVWSYDDVTGQLTFTPFVGFFAAPTPIGYRFQSPVILPNEPQAYSSPAQVSIDVGAVGLFKSATLVDTNLNGFADPGEFIAYVFTAENFGNVDLTNVTIFETQFTGAGVPPELTFQAATSLSPEGTLLVGEKAVYTATYTIVPEDIGQTITNQAEVSGDTPGGNRASDLSDSENPNDGDGTATNGPGPNNDDPTTIYLSAGPDRGDAPATYGDPTHDDSAAYWIGATPGDGDPSTQHTADATGDDADGGGDEGEEALPRLYAGLTRAVTVIVNEPTPGAAFLQAFVDFGGDGTFLTPGDQVATDIRDGGPQDLDGAVNGRITFPVAVPPTAAQTPTIARLRWSSAAGLDATAATADGEVEDYALTIAQPTDFDRGDAPASYGDPRHIIDRAVASVVHLGAVAPDADALAAAGPAADGDDIGGVDDEDGVTIPQLYRGGLAEISVIVADDPANPAFLQAFIDFNGDGGFAQAGEQVALNLQDGGALDKDGARNGVIVFDVTPPTGATLSQTFARFRWSTDDTGVAVAFEGEVEDYALTISGDPPPFLCDASLYQYAKSGRALRRLTFSAGAGVYDATATNIGTAPRDLASGWGFNDVDGYFYGVRPGKSDIYRIEGDGTFVDLGKLPSGARDGSDAGDVMPNGIMVFKDRDDEWQLIDLTVPLAVSNAGILTLSERVDALDFAYNPVDGAFYGVDRGAAQLFRVSANGGAAGTVTVERFGPTTFAGEYDSVWFDRDGGLYLYDNTANEILFVDTATGASEVMATLTADEGNASDGMSCRGPSPFPRGGVAGNVYGDDDGSDAKDGAEVNFGPGVAVFVFSEAGTPGDFRDDVLIAATETDADGAYEVGDLLLNRTYRIALDETDSDLPTGVAIGTPNPIEGVALTGGVTGGQDFGFDPAESDLEISIIAAAAGTTMPIASVAPGDAVDWIITVTSVSGGAPRGVKVVSKPPSGFDYVADDAASLGDDYDPATGLWFIDDLASGASTTLTITMTALATGEHARTAEITESSLPDLDSDPATGPLVDDLSDQIADDDEAAYAVTLLTGERILSGRIFIDDGAGGGAAHDGVANGAETGAQAAAVKILDDAGAVIGAPAADADGNWSFALDAALTGDVTVRVTASADHRAISEASGVATGDPHDGVITITPPPTGDVGGLDVGLVAAPRLTQDQTAVVGRGQVVELAHLYTATSAGEVSFSYANRATSTPNAFSAAVYRDADCDGAGDAPITGPIPVAAGDLICVVSRVSAGGGVGPGATFTYDLVATTAFARTAVSDVASNTDRITVSDGRGAVELSKTVQNLTLNSSEGTSNQGSVGDVLLYRIYLSNASTAPVASIRVFDKTPAYTALAAAAPSPVTVSPNLTCALAAPTSNAAGYAGPLEWSCAGFLNPGESGHVSFEVRISP